LFPLILQSRSTVAPNTPVNIAYTTVKADTSAISTGFGTSSSSSTLQGGMENMKAQSSEEMGAKSMNARSSEETGKEIKQQAQDAEELGERAWKVDVPIYETYGKYVARTHGRLPSGARHAAHACVILMTVLIYEGCLANKVAAVLLSVVVHGILWQLDS